MIKTLAALIVFAATVFAQPRVSLENQGTHVLCVVPIIGTGTQTDPKRPMFTPQSMYAPVAQPAPLPESPVQPGQSVQVVLIPSPPILSMQYQLSDDGKLAIVDFAGSSLEAIKPILNSNDPNVRGCFLRDTSTKVQIEAAFKQYKATFSLDTMIPTIAAAKAAQAVAK